MCFSAQLLASIATQLVPPLVVDHFRGLTSFSESSDAWAVKIPSAGSGVLTILSCEKKERLVPTFAPCCPVSRPAGERAASSEPSRLPPRHGAGSNRRTHSLGQNRGAVDRFLDAAR